MSIGRPLLNHRIRNARPCRLEWRRGFKAKIDNQLMNAVIACGGTGGHLFPGIAVAEVLRDRGHEVMLLVSEKEIADRGITLTIFACDSRFHSPLLRKPIPWPIHLSQIQTAGGPWHGRVHFYCPPAGWADARRFDIHSRIKCHSGKSESINRTHGARCHAWLQGMRAVLSKSAHGSYRHADPNGAETFGSAGCASKARTAG